MVLKMDAAPAPSEHLVINRSLAYFKKKTKTKKTNKTPNNSSNKNPTKTTTNPQAKQNKTNDCF